MNTKRGTDKYAASRALNELTMRREAADYQGDTGLYPKLAPAPAEPVHELPAFVRPQAE